MSARARRTVVYVALVALGGLGLLRTQQAIWDVDRLVADKAADDRLHDAQQCISSWQVREQIRDSDEAHGLAAGEALIEVVNPDDPAVIDQYRQALARHLRDASSEIANPTCDLGHARRVVAEPKE